MNDDDNDIIIFFVVVASLCLLHSLVSWSKEKEKKNSHCVLARNIFHKFIFFSFFFFHHYPNTKGKRILARMKNSEWMKKCLNFFAFVIWLLLLLWLSGECNGTKKRMGIFFSSNSDSLLSFSQWMNEWRWYRRCYKKNF